jgi:predicted ArsR family transcriptional regulator
MMEPMDNDFHVRGGDQLGLRAYNRRMILNLIRQDGALSKAEIARQTGLSAQAVSVIVKALLKDKLVRREKRVRGKVGQPHTPIALNADGALSVGVKIGRRSLELMLVNFRRLPTPRLGSGTS